MDEIRDIIKKISSDGLNELNASDFEEFCNRKVRNFEKPLIAWYVLEDIFYRVGDKSHENQLSVEQGNKVFAPLVESINNILNLILTKEHGSDLCNQLDLLIKKFVTIEKKLPR